MSGESRRRTSGGTDEPGRLSSYRSPPMLEIQISKNGFTVYDTDADEPVMLFATEREAEELVASLHIRELHAQLMRWSPDLVATVY